MMQRIGIWWWVHTKKPHYNEKARYFKEVMRMDAVLAENCAAATTGRVKRNRRHRIPS